MQPLNNKTILDEKKLADIPSRLFRKLAKAFKLDTSIWKTYMDDYIRELHPDDPNNMESVKKERGTIIGNINDTLWMSSKLSFNKMITGLKILRVRRVVVTIKVETLSGKEYVVEEENIIEYKK